MRPGSMRASVFVVTAIAAFLTASGRGHAADAPAGFTPLFNGRDLAGWKVPVGDNGHWKVVDGVVDYDARSEASGDKSLWTERAFGNFVLRVDWRIKDTPWVNPRVRIVMPDGRNKKGPDGKEIEIAVPDSDSGIFLRGKPDAQVNIWCWPVGSGEVYGYRTAANAAPEVRAGVTPKVNADRDIGQWNRFEITMKGELLTVVLNGVTVIESARLPGVPAKGPIALQHHGEWKDGTWTSPPALVQFRDIAIRELP